MRELQQELLDLVDENEGNFPYNYDG